ncbi:envelope stress response protein PspG [Cronobacter dublinensis]|uniref:envelope stress response protein PspG n=1 Tax=Cronobacter dublinensis TaxID=413497 RepID=UPI001375C489|nr:envelope stress response protein PspG [Cronobacter dublinensis]EKY3090646.1 envelope stress response protein PspG [Cronobacter dublinensis]ELQ6228219.1 envelope stress response protein PspG [Cronobacter dublinensis]ELY4005874.1 envelope stress response protein PspG [Cronobacter dublinensis]ELY4407218.1 envelope stress response protein PspG [Cronobacter dublinensis]ELY5819528.1 envelope stress response protein PspG [Cronobacter dublinensis]
MFELLFVVAFFLMLLATGVSLLGIIAALMVATLVMFFGGVFALMIKVLPWLLLAVAVVWVIRSVKAPKVPDYRRTSRYGRANRWRY